MRAQPLFSPGHSPGRHAQADPDFVIVSHGPDHATLQPLTARADRFLDANISADIEDESWCGGGWIVAWLALHDVLATVRGAGLYVEE